MLRMSNFKKRRRNKSIEARCMYNGKAISLSARTHKLLDEKIRNYVKEYNEQVKNPEKPTTVECIVVPEAVKAPEIKRVLFKNYALEYFETVKKSDVTREWYKRQVAKLNRYIFPIIGEKYFDEITVFNCKEIMNVITDKGFKRTGEDIHNILKQIFDYAVYDGIIRLNPMNKIKFQKHNRQHRRCMTVEEERQLLSRCKGTIYERNILLMLYAGLRPGECASATISDRFIIANNSKRKNGEVAIKRIPITPMIRPYLEVLESKIEWASQKAVEIWFANQNLDITPYCCRHTFNTRAAKCKIEKEYRELAMGHVNKSVNIDTYTHYEELMDTFFEEFQKFLYKV
ncbi:MAG: hypothetical protein J6B04_05660 [Clostridia bacterium]|nr:hypothetical protein [Clostridia bacterium]